MSSGIASILVDPETGTNLELCSAGLRTASGRIWPVRDGIPRFISAMDSAQAQTSTSFGYKWGRRESYESEAWKTTARRWLASRYGLASIEEMRQYFSTRRRILDAGCGSGFSASLWMEPAWDAASEWIGVDISTAIDIARQRLAFARNTHFVQADVLHLPFPDETFDTVFSEGVLHHTPSTFDALSSLVRVLEPRGEIFFYIYRRKGPIREFTDDYVRSVLADRSPEEAWELLRPLTKLGQALAELELEVEVPEDIPYLGITAGRHDVQRLVYWNFAKLFWNTSLTLEENVHVNFDWYSPRYAHRHSEEEIRSACADCGLKITHFDTQESGFTVRALKAAA